MNKIEKLIASMSLDDLIGQLLCYQIPLKMDDEKFAAFEKVVKETKPGGIFINTGTGEQLKKYTDMINQYVKVPVAVQGDTEHGPNSISNCDTVLPDALAWAACDDADLVERGGEETAKICRKNGFNWSLAPVVDIAMNPRAENGTRVISDSPQEVAKIGCAYMRGQQKNRHMAACAKHFPGGGSDDRNPHFCTGEISLSKEEWMNTYGYVYKELIKNGVVSIMPGHFSLPAYQSEAEYDEYLGYKPATISYDLTTKLLREELGFDGCIVSDALSMVGVAAYIPEDRMVIEFIKAGGDMALFAEPEHFTQLKGAVERGEISLERVKQSVRRILEVKDFIGLLDGEEPEIEVTGEIQKIAEEIAERSIKIVRNADNVLPVPLKEGDKVLVIELHCNPNFKRTPLTYVVEELNQRGIETTVLVDPTSHKTVDKLIKELAPACVLVNSRHGYLDSTGNSMHITWDNIMTFWRGYIFRHPKVVFTAFGDPTKLYELPFLKTYVNTHSISRESQIAFVKVLTGELEAKGKNPINLKPYFSREVFPD